MTRIVGIILLKDEEFFTPWAIANVAAFCDELILVDNYSSDRTWAILQSMAEGNPRIRLVRTRDAMTTNGLLQDYIGKDVWVFGVDGDEIYDPVRLARLRARILAGEFARHWKLKGAMLHATQIEFEAMRATGYCSPDAKAVVKLYNFARIESWPADNQRLHGNPVLIDGPSASVLDLDAQDGWEASDLRCLHMCFFPRSASRSGAIRHNLSDRRWSRRVLRAWTGLLLRLWPWTGEQRASLLRRNLTVKERAYAAGPLVRLSIEDFGRPADAPGYGELAEAQVARVSASRNSVSDIRTSPGRPTPGTT